MDAKWEALAILFTAFITFLIGMKCKSKCGCCGLQCEFVREEITDEEKQRSGKLQQVIIKRALSSEDSQKNLDDKKASGKSVVQLV